MLSRPLCRSLCSLAALLGFVTICLADEGMWLFTKPPTKVLKEKYGFEPTPDYGIHRAHIGVDE